MGKLNTRVIMGIPTTSGAVRSVGWIDAMASIQMPLGSSLGRLWIEDETIANARNALCERALEIGCDYLFFLSDDVIPPPNVLLLMLDKIGREFPVENGQTARADLITGVYWTKTYPPEPYLWNGLLEGSYRDWTAGEFFPVDLAGCDCLLIRTDVLRALPKPWFSTEWVWEPGQQPSSIATEDFYFFTKARRHGFRLFADTAIQCYHEDRSTRQWFGLTADMPQAGGQPDFPWQAEFRVADLGSGADSPYFGPNAVVTRFDGRPDVRPDVRCDLAAIPPPYHGQFDVVHARHVLEHFGRGEAPKLVRHWTELLKEGGQIVLRVPNLEYAIAVLANPRATPGEKRYAWAQLYGGQEYATDFHRNGFTARKLEALLLTTPGLADVGVEVEDGGQNLKGTATLVAHPTPEALSVWWDEIMEREHAESISQRDGDRNSR